MKYRIKEPEYNNQEFTEVCIGCGKKQIREWPKDLPLPNMTAYMGKPSWFSCHILKDHYWYLEDEVELIK